MRFSALGKSGPVSDPFDRIYPVQSVAMSTRPPHRFRAGAQPSYIEIWRTRLSPALSRRRLTRARCHHAKSPVCSTAGALAEADLRTRIRAPYRQFRAIAWNGCMAIGKASTASESIISGEYVLIGKMATPTRSKSPITTRRPSCPRK